MLGKIYDWVFKAPNVWVCFMLCISKNEILLLYSFLIDEDCCNEKDDL